MNIEQIYTKCLAQGAYYIESEGEVAVIDPLREVQEYIDRANESNSKIKYIFETHFHADFVSGHVTLAEKTGASIVYGPTANPSYHAVIAKDGQEFQVGNLTIKVLHTPGHTMESSTFLLIDQSGEHKAIFTGDTLFLGDVGRPDLAQKAGSITMDDLAGMLYDSLRNKIMPLADDIIVYPGHGAGSACGKNMMKETVDTLGNQKKMNYALRADMTKKQFITEVTDGLSKPPAYFPANVQLNKQGYESIDSVLEQGLIALNVEEFIKKQQETNAIILDVRHQSDFVKAHIPNSIFIGIQGGFAPWVGEILVDTSIPILLVTPEGKEQETVTRLSRVGFDHTLGYLKGGLEAWLEKKKQTESIESISADEFKNGYNANSEQVYDVRKEGERTVQHVLNSHFTPLSSLNNYLSAYENTNKNYVYCAGGYRSVIACSLLKRKGVKNLVNIEGGFNAIKKQDILLSQSTCSG